MTSISDMDLPDKALDAACDVIKRYQSSSRHMAAETIRAALQAMVDTGMASFTPGLGKPGDAPPYIIIRLDNADEHKRKEQP